MLPTYLFHVWLFLIRTKRSGDIEQNPGPKSNSDQSAQFHEIIPIKSLHRSS